jgi:hypothetical protein
MSTRASLDLKPSALVDAVRAPVVAPFPDAGPRQKLRALRVYPHRLAAGLVLKLPWISGDCEGDDRIRTVGDTRRFAVH